MRSEWPVLPSSTKDCQRVQRQRESPAGYWDVTRTDTSERTHPLPVSTDSILLVKSSVLIWLPKAIWHAIFGLMALGYGMEYYFHLRKFYASNQVA